MRRLLAPLLLLAGCQDYNYTSMDYTDTWKQNPPEEVDILMIIDNSGSMEPYQRELSQRFAEFLTYFIEADINYQIAGVTTDADIRTAGQFIKGTIITADTPDAATKFSELVRVGTTGSGSEMGLETSMKALTPPLVNAQNSGFLREEASLSLIYVSDEEDSSPRPVNDYINDFFSLKGQRSRDVFNASALVVTDVSSCPQGNMSVVNTRYVDVADQTNGVIGNICADNFSDIVTELSLNASRLLDTFYLTSTPNLDTLEVTVNDEVVPCDAGVWYYDMVELHEVQKPAIIFFPDSIPASNSEVAAKYNRGDGDPATFCGASAPTDTNAETGL